MSEHSQFRLLGTKRFAPFFVTQFLGAFNDNLYKNGMLLMIAFHGAAMTTMSADILTQIAGGIFILPYFLFSATAGQLADKYDKAKIARLVKVLEIVIMAIGGIGFHLQNIVLLMTALFLMGLHSTVFGPVKYAILPQHLEEDELVGGNGLVEMGTFVAILLGTVLAGLLIGQSQGSYLVAGTAVSVAVLGWLSSRSIPSAPPSAPTLKVNWNFITETMRNMDFARKNRTVFLAILGISWFWFFGSVLLSQFPNLTTKVLFGKETVVSTLLAIFSVGVGFGSLMCERLSGHKVEIGLVPLGAIGMTVFGVDFYFATSGIVPHDPVGSLAFLADSAHWRLIADLTLLGVFGGFYIVPLYALIQVESEPEVRSRIIANNNILNALFMVVSFILTGMLFKLGFTIPQVLLATALLNAVITTAVFVLLPAFLTHFLVWMGLVKKTEAG